MPLLNQIRDNLTNFSKNERKIADYILEYPFDLQKFNGETFAKNCNVSRSAVIRFCHKLGFNGYLDFRYALLSEPLVRHKDTNTIVDIHQDITLGYYEQVIEKIRESDAPALVGELAEAIMHSNRIITFGQFHSNLSAKQLSYRLLRRRINAIHISDITDFESYSKLTNPGDVVVIFSISNHDVYCEYVRMLRENRVITAVFSMEEKSVLKDMVDFYIALPSAIHAGKSYLLDDAISFFLGIELIMDAIYKKYGSEK